MSLYLNHVHLGCFHNLTGSCLWEIVMTLYLHQDLRRRQKKLVEYKKYISDDLSCHLNAIQMMYRCLSNELAKKNTQQTGCIFKHMMRPILSINKRIILISLTLCNFPFHMHYGKNNLKLVDFFII